MDKDIGPKTAFLDALEKSDLIIMAIEVRQLLIKSTVLQEQGSGKNGSNAPADLQEIKEDILAECRQLLLEMLREEQER